MKVFKRSLAVILALCMMLGVVPFTAFASENTSAYSNTTFERILHLDCGRKYFTADWIKALINEMEAAGYTHLQLAFGNDGLRFLLDDMSVGSYSDDQVTAAIKQGNKAYYDFDTNELTQSEMDEIIAHAQVQGIKIIPLLNNPGHMNAIVSAATSLTGEAAGYNGSGSTVDLENTEALGFVKGLVTKYINYFAEKGCDEFNMGADEYANDVYPTGSMGFGALVSADKYQLFVEYVNDMADLIDDVGMTPIAFNDGIYFNQDTSYNFNKGIKVAFWTSGWTGYQSAPASEMARLGHEMINVNGAYYYVLGKNDKWTPGETTTHNPDLYTEAGSWINSGFMGSNVSDPAGAMFCIWCDYPNAETETQIAANTRMILRAMAAEMKDEDGTAVDNDIVPGGFNADGTINDSNQSSVTDQPTSVTVTAPDLNGLVVEEVGEKELPEIEGAAHVKAWDMTPKTSEGNYTASGKVKVSVPEGWDTSGLGAFVVESDGTVKLLTGSYADGYYTYTVPHFSVNGIYDTERAAEGDDGATPDTENRTINLILGETTTNAIEGVNYAGTYNTEVATITAVYEQVVGGMEPVQVTDVLVDESYYLKNNSGKYLTASGGETSNIEQAALWTVTQDENGLYLLSNNNNYLLFEDGWVPNAYNPDTFTFENGVFRDSYVNTQVLTPFSIEGTGTVNQTTVTFTGTSVGSATVDIGPVHYTVNVDYTEKTINIVKNGSRTEEQSVTVADHMDVTSMTNAYVTATWSGNTVTFTANSQTGTVEMIIGNTKYTVHVIEENLDNVAPLTIEYWQTNSHVKAPDSTSGNSLSVSAEDAYSEEGLSLFGNIPATGYKDSTPVIYWRSRLLADNERQEQGAGADDRTWSGTGFTKVRYWNGSWAVYTDAGEWMDIETANYQLVAYYMNDMNLADEVKVGTPDWSKKGNESPDYAEEGYVSIVYQVIYEDGTSFPADVTTSDVGNYSYIVNAWRNSSGQVQRGVGTISLTKVSEYEIWKVTATTGTHTLSGNNTISSISWDPNERTLFENYENPVSQYTIHNPAQPQYVNIDSDHENLYWDEENESILIRIYIKAAATEPEVDSLKVVYHDEKFGVDLAELSIIVPHGNNFNNNIVVANSTTAGTLPVFTYKDESGNTITVADRVNASGFGIVNIIPKTQNFETNLANVAVTNNRYAPELYKYTGSVVSGDGSTITHYYTIDQTALSPNFVVDFGLPMTFNLSDVVKDGINTVKKVTVIPTTKFGTLSYNSETQVFTYTPKQILTTIDVLTISILFDGQTTATTTNVGVTPATTVYYEEGFLFTDTEDLTGWTGTDNFGGGTQAAEVLGEHTYNYGYDPAYADDAAGSDGKYAVATVTNVNGKNVGAYTSFTFTGTGFELYANSKEATGIVSVLNKSNKLTKLYRIDTKLMNGDTGITTYADGATTEEKTYYSLPIISETDLEHGEYTVTIKQNNGKNGALYIDGVRIINTVDQTGKTCENNIYYTDKEDNPDFYELRDMVLHAAGVGDLKESDYISQNNRDGLVAEIEQMAGQVYNNVNGATAIIIDESLSYADSKTLQDLLDNGPKNELYLSSGQTLSFSVNTNRVLQLGLKAPKGEAIFKVTVDGTDKTVGEETTITNSDDESETWGKITSTVDMFYKIADQIANSETTTTHTVTITVKSGLLSVTKLKICDDPNAAFVALTQEDIENALLGIYGLTDDKTPVEPEEPAAEADAVLAITLTDGKKEMGTAELTAVGAEGEKHTFTAEEILNAVLDAMPDLYKVSDESAIADVAVKYGETGKLTVDIELEFEFDMDSWWRQVRTLMNRIFTIIADAGKGGSITNEGSADVKFRKDITYTITPDEGYEIESVIVDGKDVGAVSEYTFRRVRNDHRISVTFKEVQ